MKSSARVLRQPQPDQISHDDLIIWLARKEAKALLAEPVVVGEMAEGVES